MGSRYGTQDELCFTFGGLIRLKAASNEINICIILTFGVLLHEDK